MREGLKYSPLSFICFMAEGGKVMHKKYTVTAFHFPYTGRYERVKETNSLFVAIFYLTVWRFRYFGVNLEKRG